MKKGTIILFTIAILIVAGTLVERQKTKDVQDIPVASPTTAPTQAVSFTASFAIYTNGTKRIFTDPKYHNRSRSVYIESKNPEIIQVNTKGVTWGDFFDSLPMKLTHTCLTTGTGQMFCNDKGKLSFSINGKEKDNFLSLEIQPNDYVEIRFTSQK